MFKKLLLSFFAGLLLLQSTILPVYAQGQVAPWYDTDIRDWYIKVYSQQTSPPSEIFGERYTAAQVQWVVYSLIAVIMNIVFDSTFTSCVLGQAGQNAIPMSVCVTGSTILDRIRAVRDMFPGAAADGSITDDSKLADSNRVIQFFNMTLNNRGSSGIAYLRSTFNKITLVPEANAQEGYGYTQLDALRSFWTKSRDISYGLLIFAAIILAFMVMFRTKISPQTVITAQSAIPKLIFAIILITFSYAIAGFMIDLVYVVIGLLAAVLTENADQLQQAYHFMTSGPANLGIFGMFSLYAVIFPALFGFTFVGTDTSGSYTTPILGPIIAAVGGLFWLIIVILVFLIVAIVLIVAWVRTLFLLVRTLVNVYLLVIFAPFYIVFGTVTSALGFGQWLRSLISNLAVFPAVGLMFMLSVEFMKQGAQLVYNNLHPQMAADMDWIFSRIGLGNLEPLTDIGSGAWGPPLLGGGGWAPLLLQIVSLSIIVLIPNIGNIIQGFLSGRPFAYGSGIGEAFGPLRTGAQGTGQYMSSMQQSQYATALKTTAGPTPRQSVQNAVYDTLGRVGLFRRH